MQQALYEPNRIIEEAKNEVLGLVGVMPAFQDVIEHLEKRIKSGL